MRSHPPTPAVPAEALPTVLYRFNGAGVATLDERMTVAQFTAGSLVPDYTVETLANGNKMVRGLKIFRAGTFKDSKSRKNTWTAGQLGEMVSNFSMLVERGLFVDVPWRTDHTGSVKDLVGYIRGLRSDASFLYADLEFTEAAAFEKFASGTYRARSAEVGFYESNDEELFWPVVAGVAFVDVGAVEGLYQRADLNKFNLLSDDKDTNVTEEQFNAACAYAQALIDLGLEGAVTAADHQAAITTATAEATAQATALHAAGAPVTFQVFGRPVTDVGAVQTHIVTLETAASEQISAGRSEFVKGLATANKIAAPQVAGLTVAALEMTDATFAAFKASYESAPANALFAIHGPGPANPGGESADLDDQIAVAEGVVAQHRFANMAEDVLKETHSFKRLEALRAEKAGTTAA